MAQKPTVRKKTKPRSKEKNTNTGVKITIAFVGLIILCVIILSAFFFAISVVNKGQSTNTSSNDPTLQMQRFSISTINQTSQVFSNSIYDQIKQITGITLDKQIKVRDEIPSIALAADAKTIEKIDIALNIYPDINSTDCYPAKFIYTKETDKFEFLLSETLENASTSIEIKKNALSLTLKHIFDTMQTMDIRTLAPTSNPYLLEIAFVDEALNQNTIDTISSLDGSKKITLADSIILAQGEKIKNSVVPEKTNIVVYQLKTSAQSQALPIICLLEPLKPLSESSSSSDVSDISEQMTPQALMESFVTALKNGDAITIQRLLNFDTTGNFSDLETVTFNDISFELESDTPSLKTYNLMLDILSSNSAIFTKGKSNWTISIDCTSATKSGVITNIEKKTTQDTKADPLTSFIGTIVSFGVTNFTSTSEIPPADLVDICMALIQAEKQAQGESEVWDFTEKEINQAAKTYFGIPDFDGTSLPSYDQINGSYFILGRGLIAYEQEVLEKKWDEATQTYAIKMKFSSSNMANATSTLFVDGIVKKNSDGTPTIMSMQSS